jgi:hypothetical protein
VEGVLYKNSEMIVREEPRTDALRSTSQADQDPAEVVEVLSLLGTGSKPVNSIYNA